MEIQEIKLFNAPNIFSLSEPIVKMQVKLGELAEIPSKDIGNLNDNIISLFPGIKAHKCAKGYVGGFVERLQEGTYLAHIAEHLCLETQKMLGYDIKHGKARQVRDDIYNIIFSCTHLEIGKACGNFIINTLNALIEGKEKNIDIEIQELRKLCAKYDLGVSTRAIIEGAKKRGIPISLVNNGELVRLGYGKYQKLITATLDCTDIIHPKNKEIAELAAKTIGLDIAGIDMVIPDIAIPMKKVVGAIIEVNAAPGIHIHFNPTIGAKRYVVSPILDILYPKDTPFTIPVVSITGTNGKTTTTRMISRILKNTGYTVGTTTTHGIFINDKCIEEGDTTGPKSATRILYNKEVDAAVLETARGGILRDGLAYEKADVAVFTNLTEDHLGIDGISTMEELLHAKSLVIEAVKDDGACILNADSPWIMKVKEKAKGEIVLFSLEESNPLLLEHINKGGCAVYGKGDIIYISYNGIDNEIIRVQDIPATLEGGLKHNIYNSMAAIGACFSLGIPIATLRDTLHNFSCNVEINPGRFNIYDMGDFKVILDYGHNFDGYKMTIEGLKSLIPSRLIGIIGVPGDRRDIDIEKIGTLCGNSFNKIIIKEDEELRGRKPLEVAKILLKSVLQSNIGNSNVEIIRSEKEALIDAIRSAESGDVIVVFFEKMEPLMEIVMNHKKRDTTLTISKEPILV